MMVPKVVVFDLGKVLLDFDYRIAAEGLAGQSSVSPVQIQQFIDHSPLLVQYEKGQMTREQFFQAVRDLTGYRGSLADFSALFSDVFTPIEPMVELKRRLTASGVPTYIFSNTNDLAIHHIRLTYPFFNEFNGYVLSYEYGHMKPEPQLYEAVEAMSGQSGNSICYLDDRAENVQAATSRGWNAIVHNSPDASITALKQFGLNF